MDKSYSDVRPSPIAGTWYSADKEKLRGSIDDFLTRATPPNIEGEVIALMVPHAGHIYSGLTAAHAYKTVRGKSFEQVVILSPSHQYYPQPLLTSAHQAYQTPLGFVPVARKTLEQIDLRLKEEMGIALSPVKRDPEHSLEIELPFLQRSLPNEFQLIPIMMRDQSASLAKGLGAILAELCKEPKTLFIASTDLSHFYNENQAQKLDQAVLKAVADFDIPSLYELHASGKGQACGLGALACVMWAAKTLGANLVKVVDYRTSADVTGDKSSVVGYGAAVFAKAA